MPGLKGFGGSPLRQRMVLAAIAGAIRNRDSAKQMTAQAGRSRGGKSRPARRLAHFFRGLEVRSR